MNTHAPSPFAGEGIYDWLRHREPRWARLAIIQRLDKDTSGVLVFAKTGLANHSLTEQFTRRVVRKKYLLITDQPVKKKEFVVKSALVRAGERYLSCPLSGGGQRAETRFRALRSSGNETQLEAEPVTGKTHQIRVHAAANGFPILGDALYGGTPAARLHLHAEELVLNHPLTGREICFTACADFAAEAGVALRSALIDLAATNAFRLINGAADGWRGWYVDRLGDFLLSQSERPLTETQRKALKRWLESLALRGAWHQTLTRQVRRAEIAQGLPQMVFGDAAPDEFLVRENGARFALSINEGSSVGLFLDQRDNRRRLLTGHVAANFSLFDSKLGTRNSELEVLNTFAYTCGFSVCAALSGARTTNVDLSRNYLAWGTRNFTLNRLDAAQHDFLHGDAWDWMRRLAKKQRRFDVVVLDPPTFSQSKRSGTFRAEKDFGALVIAALPLLKPDGVLFASTNAGALAPEKFLEQVTGAIRATGTKVRQQHYSPQPPDFPVSREEPGYLKTIWLRIA